MLSGKFAKHGSSKRSTVRARATTSSHHSYLDRATDYDRVFYIYYLGCFNNIPIYHYGETADIALAELKVKKTVPFYERVWYTPVDHNVNIKAEFDELIRDNRAKIMLPDVTHWDAFTTDNIDAIVERCANMDNNL